MRIYIALAALLLATLPAHAQQRITLPVKVVRQQTMVWCWLAVSEMIIKYYDLEQSSPRQCQMVAAVRGMPARACCGGAPQCVTPGGIDEIAKLIEHYSGYRPTVVGPPARPSQIARALKKNKVLVAALANPDGGGHVVVVRGIQRTGRGVELLINDPMSKFPDVVDFNTFRRRWTQTIIVQFKPGEDDDDGSEDDD